MKKIEHINHTAGSSATQKINEIIDVINQMNNNNFPQIGDTVFLFNSQGDSNEVIWTNTKKQNRKRDFLGVFRTKEEAHVKAKQLALGELDI